MTYADTSFLVALYLKEERSAKALHYLAEHPKPLTITFWNEIEILNAFSLNVHFARITETERKQAEHRWNEDIALGYFNLKSIPEEKIIFHSKKIIARHHSKIPARSLDLIHIASALAIKSTHFLSFDQRQSKLAQLCGLNTPLY